MFDKWIFYRFILMCIVNRFGCPTNTVKLQLSESNLLIGYVSNFINMVFGNHTIII